MSTENSPDAIVMPIRKSAIPRGDVGLRRHHGGECDGSIACMTNSPRGITPHHEAWCACPASTEA